MSKLTFSATLLVAALGLKGTSAAQAVLDPSLVLAKWAEIVQISVSPSMPSDTFVNLLPIGLAVDADQKYFPWADSCMKPILFSGSLNSMIRVSDVYELALDNMARVLMPSQPTSAEVAAARTFYNQHLEQYDEFRKNLRDLRLERDRASTQAERSALNEDMLAVEQQWIVNGYKREVEAALATINNSPAGFLGFHKNALQVALGTDAGPGTSPSVSLSVSRENWDEQGGWVTVLFEDTYSSRTEETRIRQRRGSGGFSGLISIGGGGGSTDISESIVIDMDDLKIELDLQLVMIDRPWLNTSVFFQPQTWGWKAVDGAVGEPPVVSRGLADDLVATMEQQFYAGNRVDCQLIPTGFLLAKRRNLTATVSKDSYNKILQESNAGGSVGFFGFNISGSGSDKLEVITETESKVVFSIKSLDWADEPNSTINVSNVVILGTVSQVVPLGPRPSSELTYETGLWEAEN